MATMAADGVFVDTNVLIYSSRTKSPFHHRANAALRDERDLSRRYSTLIDVVAP